MIYHIYWGTAGNAGLYLDEIYQTLYKAGYEQRVFVNYYYPFDYGEKIFFKRTEMEHCRFKGRTRSFIQAWEVLIAFLKILCCAIKDKPQIVNYSYVGFGNILTLWFLKLLKRSSRCKLVFTCHDVVPFGKTNKIHEKELSIKKRIFKIGDFFIVHNPDSRNDLKRLFDIKEEQILEHPFPLMDLSKLDKGEESTDLLYDFLFIGHIRKSKGIEFLLDAWEDFHRVKPEATLCIAGNHSMYRDYFESKLEFCEESNVVLKLGFVKDCDYKKLVKQSKCVVFPYLAGTNSGVISTVLSLNKNVIASDIPMFATNPLLTAENLFKCNDKEDFLKALVSVYDSDVYEKSIERIKHYRETFGKRVILVYNSLLKIV